MSSIVSPDDIHRIFKTLDKNNKGQVSVHELQHLLDKTGIHTTLEDLEKLVGGSSLDSIEFYFFYNAMVNAKLAEHENDNDNPNDDLFKAFKVFDLNGDGYISCEELQSVLTRLGLWDKRNGQDCKDMIRVYDENSDGVLDFDEFKNMMSAPNSSSSDDSE